MPCSADKNTTTFLKKNPESVLKAMSLSNNIVQRHTDEVAGNTVKILCNILRKTV